MRNFGLVVVLIIFSVAFDCRAEFLFSRLDRQATPQSNCFYNVKTVFSGGGREGVLLGNLVLMTSNTVVKLAKNNIVMYPEVECSLRPLSAAGMKRLRTKERWCCLYNITEYSSCERFDKVEGSDCKLCPILGCNDSYDCLKEDDGVGGLNGLLSEFQNCHGIIFKSGLWALRDGSATKGRHVPITRNADGELTLFSYAIAVREHSDKQNGCLVKFGYEIFRIRGSDVICQGGGVCSYQVDLANFEMVDMSATGLGKVDAKINDSNISFTLIQGSKSRRIQFQVEDIKDVLAHLCDTMSKKSAQDD